VYPLTELLQSIRGANRVRALGRRGPGIVPKRFKPLLNDERETDGLWSSFGTWVDRASAGDIVAAYEASRNPVARYYMCYQVGRRGLHAALPMLVHALNDPDSGVRNEAADALGRIGDPSTGYDLFKHYAVEDDPGVRVMLLLALGWTRYAPALPTLIAALTNASPGGDRAWIVYALANMGDTSALPALRQAYAEEPESKYAYKEYMRRAIEELERSGATRPRRRWPPSRPPQETTPRRDRLRGRGAVRVPRPDTRRR
jgi:hypothetical protein